MISPQPPPHLLQFLLKEESCPNSMTFHGPQYRECWFDWVRLKNGWETGKLQSWSYVHWTSGLSDTLLLFSEWIMAIPGCWHPGMTPKALVFWSTRSSLVYNALRPCWALCTNEKNRPLSCRANLVHMVHMVLMVKLNVVSLLSNLALKTSFSCVSFPSCHSVLQINSGSRRLSSSYYQYSHCIPRTNQHRG